MKSTDIKENPVMKRLKYLYLKEHFDNLVMRIKYINLFIRNVLP